MIALLNWRLAAVLALATLLAATHWRAYTRGQVDVQQQWDADRAQVAEQTSQVLQAAAKQTADLQAQAETARKVKNAQIATLNAELSDALDRLRDRPARPGARSLPSDTALGPTPSCTGAQLYRDDAQFLIRFAGQANRLRADLGECQAAHAAARGAVSGAAAPP